MARPNKKFTGILSTPLPINPTKEDNDIRIDALLDYYKIKSEKYNEKLHILTGVLLHLNKLDPLMNLKDVCLMFDKTATWDSLIKSARYFYLKLYQRLPNRDEYLEYIYKHAILKLANKLEIPAFMPTNLYALLRKRMKVTKRFMLFRDIMYFRYVYKMKEDDAIEKYIKDNNLIFKKDVDGINSIKRTYKEIKAKNKQVRKFYSMEYIKPIFEAFKSANLISQDAELRKNDLKWIGTLGILLAYGKESYNEIIRCAKAIEDMKSTKIFNEIETAFYTKMLKFDNPPTFL